MIKIDLPLPNSKLLPNRSFGRSYHATKELRIKAHTEGYKAARAYFGMFSEDSRVKITVRVFKKTTAYYDLDNLLASMKKHIDGVFSGLGIDDKQIDDFRVTRGGVDKLNPRIELFISEIKE